MPEGFGRYQLLRKLATGGMAEIYLARQQGLEGFSKLLVIKRILPHLSGNDDFVKMFLDEARIAARLNHANVVQIFDLGQEGEHFFIAMEYLHGEDARRVWKQADRMAQPLPVPLACRIVMDACAGLDYAHKKTDEAGRPLNIVHRDVSPQNIIVTFEGGVKVVDFGIAKAADQSSRTRSGVGQGKYSSMSPEQAAGKKVDARTDQFALGIVLYELLTGTRLFKRQSDIETLRAVEKCQVEPPSVVNPRVPGSLDAVVLKALSKNLDDRYKDCQAFQLALDAWLVQNRLPSSSAQLASFLSGIYAERLDEERRIGHPLWEEDLGSGPMKQTGPSDVPSGRAMAELIDGPRTTVAKPRGHSGVGLRPDNATPSSGAVALAAGAEPREKPPPPVKTNPSLGLRPSARPTAHERPNAAAPRSGGFAELALDDGNTVSEQQTLSTTSDSIPSAVANARARRSLWIGAGAAAVVMGLGGLALTVLTQKPTPVPAPAPAVSSTPKSPSKPAPAKLASIGVVTLPSGAEVTLNGELRGKSPIAPADFALGSVLTVTARLEGYEPLKQTIQVERDQVLQLALTRRTQLQQAVGRPEPQMAARGAVALDSALPLEATLDGRPIRVPFRESVPAGRHRLVVSSRSLDYTRAFELNVRGGQTEAPAITPGVGKVLVVIKNQGYGDVLVAGVKHGQAPMPAFDLAEGLHTVVVKNADLGKSKSQQVKVTAGQTTTVTFDLDN